MTACDASNEIELAACPISLAKESNFQTALRCATPKRRTALEKILIDQTESCLQRCKDKRRVSSLDMLAKSTVPLMNDPDFVMAFECADTAMKSELHSIVSRQSEFLAKRRKKRKETIHVALWVISLLVIFLFVFLKLFFTFSRSAKMRPLPPPPPRPTYETVYDGEFDRGSETLFESDDRDPINF